MSQRLRAVPSVAESQRKPRNANAVVAAISEIHFQGNILPLSWLQHPLLHYDSGKVNLNAAVILSDIVYWYRATEVRDEESGKVVSRRRKFDYDMLQKSNQAWADLFGLTKRQVQAAVAFLKKRGLIDTELRNIKTKGGLICSNVQFVEPVPEMIAKITEVEVS